jgi:uncharacterized membrane protein YesL
MILNFLWILTSMMGFGLTIGLATGGLYYAVRHGMKEDKRRVFHFYLEGIKKHWKQTTAIWLLLVLALLAISLVSNYAQVFFGQAAGLMLPLYWILGLEAILLSLYAYPLAVNGSFSFKALLVETFKEAHGNLIPTIKILLTFAAAFVLIVRVQLIFLYLLPSLFAWWLDGMIVEKMMNVQNQDQLTDQDL